MKYASFIHNGKEKWGAVNGDSIHTSEIHPKLLDYIISGIPDKFKGEAIPLDKVHLLAPFYRPKRNVFCVGRNYYDHIMELNDQAEADKRAKYPAFFTKATMSVTGPYSNIMLHKNVTDQLDYEVELAVIIGKKGMNIAESDAIDYVFGYTVLNDISARDLQINHLQWVKGKGLDTSCPMGPWVVDKSDIEDPHNLNLCSTVNGEIRQNANTRLMMWRIPQLISILSAGMTIFPGDVLATGTPAGVGKAMKPPCFLKNGDIVKCEVEGIGYIENIIKG